MAPGEGMVLSDAQKKIIMHGKGALRVCAGPGTGKTTAMAARAKRLIEEGVSPSRLLIATYSRRAACEIREQFEPDKTPAIKTLHAVGYQIIRRCQPLIGRKKLATRVDYMTMLQELLLVLPQIPQIDESDESSFIKSLELLLKTFGYIDQLGEEEYVKKYPYKDSERILLAKTMFSQKLAMGGYITYDEQIECAVKILEQYPDICRSAAGEYEYIQIDEAQDMDASQVRLIRMLVSAPGNNIAVFGDMDQAIYGFRGGSDQFLLDFEKYYPDTEEINLEENYRSTQEILEAASTLISHNRNRVPLVVKAKNRSDGRRPQWIRNFSINRIGDLVQDIIRDNGCRPGQIAVIARTNADLIRVGCMFDLHNGRDETVVPIRYELPKYYLYQDAAFQILLDALSVALGEYQDNDRWIRLLSAFGIRAEKNCTGDTIYEEYVGRDEIYAFDSEEASLYCMSPENGEGIRCGFAKIYRVCQMFGLPLEQAVPRAVEALCESQELDYKPALRAILDLARERRMRSPEELWKYMRGMCTFRDSTRVWHTDKDDRVHMLTAHDAKGRQYPIVIIYGADKFETGDLQEDRRLLYVAMTRAEKLMVVTEEHKGSSMLLKEAEQKFRIIGGNGYA